MWATRRAFESLLEKCARSFEWFVVAEYQIARSGKSPLRVDAAVLDAFNLPRGYWEAKDEKDDLKEEMNKKFAAEWARTGAHFYRFPLCSAPSKWVDSAPILR